MLVLIKTLTGKTIAIEVAHSDTIQSIKENPFEREDYRPEQYRLIFQGKYLEDEKTFAYYNSIQENSVLHLVLRLN